MELICHYSILGVDKNASIQEITAAYSASLARFRKHLSVGSPQPIEQFDAIRQAYRTLSCPEQRRSYDQVQAQVAAVASTQGILPISTVTAAAPVEDFHEARVEFRGSGEEYFRIWLVNIALTLLTLGIYSAWAKIRREKYFHRNMIIDGSAFDYHGKARAILLGRIILMLFFLLASFSENVGSTAKLAVSLLGIAAFPWLLVQSMRFRARNTSYRGIRFSFSGKYRHVLVLFLLHGGLCLLTLGLYFPVFLQKQKAFVARHLVYGNTPARFSAGIVAFYRGLALPLILWCLLLAGIVAVALMTIPGGKSQAFIMVLLYGLPLLGLLIVFMQLVLFPYTRVVGTNLLWNHLTVGKASFRSTQKVRSYLGIVVSNWTLTLLTLGFFWPLGQIRLANFRARNLTVIASHTLSNATANEQHEASALGSETMATIDLDIAL